MYVKLTRIEDRETLLIWLSCAEQQDQNILQLIDICKQKMNVVVFLSGNQYTLKETVNTLISNHLKQKKCFES